MGETKFVTVALNPSKGWSPCKEETGYYGQLKASGPHTWAVDVDYTDVTGQVIRMHGPWTTREQAQRFAYSMCVGDRAKPVQVTEYYYEPSFAGAVTPDVVHDLDDANAADWSHRPVGAVLV